MPATPQLSQLLTLHDTAARTREDIFTGSALPTPSGRSFGGQVLGQAIAAAGRTVPEDRVLHSLHGYFLRPGDTKQTMTFEVARLHNGRSFSTRRVQTYQRGEALMSLIASFQLAETGLEHQRRHTMSDIIAPEKLPTVWQKYGHLTDTRASWLLDRPFDIRHIDGDIAIRAERPSESTRVWLRSREPFDAPQLLHSAALAFASDYLLVEPILRRHAIPWATPGMRAASLDHAMWFHRPFRVDEWLLYELETPAAQGARGLSQGHFYSRSGELLASVAQESMVRTQTLPGVSEPTV